MSEQPTIQPTTHINAEMTAALGTVLGRRVSYPVSESDIRRWALAVYWPEEPPARFLDPDVAAKTRWGGIVAPEEFNPFAWAVQSSEQAEVPEGLDSNNPRRTELMLGITPPEVNFMLNGGIDITYGEPIRPADVITAVSKLAAYTERSGRLGLMLFTTTEDTWTNQRGEMVRKTRGTIIRY